MSRVHTSAHHKSVSFGFLKWVAAATLAFAPALASGQIIIVDDPFGPGGPGGGGGGGGGACDPVIPDCLDEVVVPLNDQCRWDRDPVDLGVAAGDAALCEVRSRWVNYWRNERDAVLTCEDACEPDGEAVCETRVVALDLTPPVISQANAGTSLQMTDGWQWNWTSIEQACGLDFWDNCSRGWVPNGILNIQSSDPTEVIAGGPGAFESDFMVADWHGMLVTLDRGVAAPRTYTVTYGAVDRDGNLSQVNCEVAVVDDPPADDDDDDDDADEAFDEGIVFF